jgi:hypothetical protein
VFTGHDPSFSAVGGGMHQCAGLCITFRSKIASYSIEVMCTLVIVFICYVAVGDGQCAGLGTTFHAKIASYSTEVMCTLFIVFICYVSL